MEYTVKKGRYGWEANSSIPMEGGFALKLNTYKGPRGLVTLATRVKVEEYGGFSYFPMSDYSRTVESHIGVRATEKTVKAVHEAALAKLDSIKAEIATFYALKAKEPA